MMDRFKVSSLGMRPRVPVSSCERKYNCGTDRLGTAPRGISHHRSRPVSGLVGSVRIAFPGARAPSGRALSRTQSAGLGLLVDTPARTYRCGGSRGFGRTRDSGFRQGRTPSESLLLNPQPHLFPVSPRRKVRAGTPRTSALIVQHKSRGSVLRRHRESTLKTNAYTLT
jgi:hypothetical protein